MKTHIKKSIIMIATTASLSLSTSGLSDAIETTTSSTASSSKGIFHPRTFKLKNGFQVILVENHLSPVVSISLLYKIGTADDPSELVGISHFLEHLMFKATKNLPIGEFTKRIVAKGGSINAFTTPDVTCYTCDIAKVHLPMILEFEADRMQNLIFDEKETLSEQKVVVEERKMRLDNHPLGAAHETVLKALHKYHPYSIPTIGYPQHIAAYTNDNAKEHYNKWYTPNNATLIISGDVTMEELQPLVEKYFAGIPQRKLPDRVRPQDPIETGTQQSLRIESPRVSYITLDWYYPGPRYVGGKIDDLYSLSILTQILGGDDTSRLYEDLVDKRHLVLDVHMSNDVGIDPQHIEVSVTLHPDHKPLEVRRAVEKHIHQIVKKGITQDELVTAKRDILADLAFSRDGNSGAIKAFQNIAYGFTVEDIESYADRINAVTLEQVNEAAKTYLGGRPVVFTEIYPTGHAVGDESEQVEAAEELGVGDAIG